MDENPWWQKYTIELLIIFNIVIPFLLSIFFYFYVIGHGILPYFKAPSAEYFLIFDIWLYLFTICYSIVMGALFGFSKYNNKIIFYTYAMLCPFFFYLIPTIILFFATSNPFIHINLLKVFILMIFCILFELMGILIKKEIL